MANSGMQWSGERVERLRKLWAEGLSASQIAADMGGVTRNAVIGKVHRLGLSGRKVAAAKVDEPSRRSRKISKGAPISASVAVRREQRRGSTFSSAVAEVSAAPEAELEAAPSSADVVPLARYLTLLDLGPTTCRWPIGDPRLPGFRFCGAPTEPGEVYCRTCARKAYQPAPERSRGKAHARTSR